MTPKICTERPNWLELASLILILILASALRLSRLDLSMIGGDQVYSANTAFNLAHGKGFPLMGMVSSVGIPNPPMTDYIIGMLYLLSDEFVVVVSLIAVMNIIGIGLLYGVARRYYGPRVAVIAALLYAVNPFAVAYSRMLWPPDLMSPFVIGAVGTALLGFLEGKRWAQLLHLPLVFIVIEIHYAAIVLLPVTALLIFVGRRKLRPALLVGAGLAGLTLVPFVFGLVQASYLGGGALQESISRHESFRTFQFTNAALYISAAAISGGEPSSPGSAPHLALLPVAALAAAGWLLVRAVRRHDNRSPVDLALVAWAVTTPVIFTIPWTSVYDHYMPTMLPGALLTFTVGLVDMLSLLPTGYPRRIGAALSVVYLGVVTVSQVSVSISVLAAPAHQFGSAGYFMAIRQALLAYNAADIVIDVNDSAQYDSERRVWNIFLHHVPAVRYIPAGINVYPVQKTLYLSHRCSGGAQVFPSAEGICYAISWRGPGDLDQMRYTPINPNGLTFASGTALTGYAWEPAKGCLTLVWHVQPARLPVVEPGLMGQDFHFLIQFYDSSHTVSLQTEQAAWQNGTLAPGETATRTYCIAGDPERFQKVVGVRLTMLTTGGAQTYGQDLLAADSHSVGNWPDQTSWFDIPLAAEF